MCGRFVQYRGIADYLDVLASDRKIVSGYDNHPIGRYNIAPCSRVNILHGVEDGLRIDPVHWGLGKRQTPGPHQRPRRNRHHRQILQTTVAQWPCFGHGRWMVRVGQRSGRPEKETALLHTLEKPGADVFCSACTSASGVRAS